MNNINISVSVIVLIEFFKEILRISLLENNVSIWNVNGEEVPSTGGEIKFYAINFMSVQYTITKEFLTFNAGHVVTERI